MTTSSPPVNLAEEFRLDDVESGGFETIVATADMDAHEDVSNFTEAGCGSSECTHGTCGPS
jgi:hypothetical protein